MTEQDNLMPTTTLAALREHKACVDGYNKLACRVTGSEFDESMDEWVETTHNEDITIKTILESNGIEDALWALRAFRQTPALQRAERLFAVWCARQVQCLCGDPRSLEAINVAEAFANGNATAGDLSAAWGAPWGAARNAACGAAWGAARDAARGAAWDAARGAVRDAACGAAWDAAWDAARDAARQSQSKMFELVFCGSELNTDVLYKQL